MNAYAPLKRLVRLFLGLWLLSLPISSTGLYGQSPENSPLTPEEKRQILLQLYELRSCREEIKTYELFVQRESDLANRERANSQRALELEKQATDQAKEEAAFYKQAFQSITKKAGVGCWLKRIFTIGIARCN